VRYQSSNNLKFDAKFLFFENLESLPFVTQIRSTICDGKKVDFSVLIIFKNPQNDPDVMSALIHRFSTHWPDSAP
jgi:hypothetical protein